ncbi:MAG: hypothetical protein V4722_13695 [Bacteroidota bacterium]
MYSKIPFEEVKLEIEKIFRCPSGTEKWDLLPEYITQLAQNCGIKLKWRPILKWDVSWGPGKISNQYSDEDFLAIAFAKVKPSNNPIFIITDECFRDKMAFSVGYKDMLYFMDKVYPELFKMGFPQPSDFIFVQPDTGLLTMIYHEGVRTKYVAQ